VDDTTRHSALLLSRQASTEWLKTARALYDYLRRNMGDSDEERKRLYPVNWSRHVPRYVPWLYAIARELATLYLQAPSRRFLAPDGSALPPETSRMLEAAYRRLEVNATMKQAQRMLVALNNATVWVQPHYRSGTAQLVLVPLHDQEVELATAYARDEDDVALWRYMVPIPQRGMAAPSSIPAVAAISATEAYWESAPTDMANRGVWSADKDANGKYINPFGTIPVVMMRGTPQAPGYWWSPLPRDLLTTQRAINHDLTDVGHIARMQGYGQPVAKGVSGGQTAEIQLGPETVVGVPQDGDFSFASANPKLKEYADSNADYVSQVVAMNGMNPASFLKSSGITALAKQVELMDRESFRREHIEVMQRAEQRLYDVLRLVINYQRGSEIWPEAIVEVDYREPIMPADPLHHVQALERAVALGQTSRVRARAVADGITPDEALARIIADKAMDVAAGYAGAPVETVADDTSTPVEDVAEVETSAPESAPPQLDVAEGADVQKAALNGAQVAEMVGVLTEVAGGRLPAASARAILLAAYPLDERSVDAMLAPLSGFRPTSEPSPIPPVMS
jgi:hypothetical protein